MPVCNTCGAILDENTSCPYDASEERAPWRGDYDAMNRGLMTHQQHALVVARWGLHNPQKHGSKALDRFRMLAAESWGTPLTLFLLDD